MSELNLPTETSAMVDTNAEYILPEEAKKQPPVLLSVSKAIIVETVRDFFGSIIGFFLRYIKHFIRCFVYFVNPSLQKKPFNKLDFKQNAQHSFEFLIIMLALIIFMEKLEWIPQTSSDMMDLYSNDLVQKFMEVYLFIIFAVLYLLMTAISIFTGRFFRMVFKVKVSRDESDILFTYLNSAFFSIAVVSAFILRCAASTATHDEESIALVVSMILAPAVVGALIIWGFRFAQLHGLGMGKGILFFLFSLVFYGGIYFASSFLVTALLLAI